MSVSFLHLSHTKTLFTVGLSTSDIFGIFPIFYLLDLQRTYQHDINIGYQLYLYFLPPSDPEETPKSLDDEIDVFNSSSLHYGFDRPTFSAERVLFCRIPWVSYYVSRNRT